MCGFEFVLLFQSIVERGKEHSTAQTSLSETADGGR